MIQIIFFKNHYNYKILFTEKYLKIIKNFLLLISFLFCLFLIQQIKLQ